MSHLRNLYHGQDDRRTICRAVVIVLLCASHNLRSSSSPAADELLYGKDAPCPPEWRDWVDGGKVLPPVLCPKGPGDLFQYLDKSVSILYSLLTTPNVYG